MDGNALFSFPQGHFLNSITTKNGTLDWFQKSSFPDFESIPIHTLIPLNNRTVGSRPGRKKYGN